MNEKIIFMVKPLDEEAKVNPSACPHPDDKIKPAYVSVGYTDLGIPILEAHRICMDCFLIDPFEHATNLAPVPVQ